MVSESFNQSIISHSFSWARLVGTSASFSLTRLLSKIGLLVSQLSSISVNHISTDSFVFFTNDKNKQSKTLPLSHCLQEQIFPWFVVFCNVRRIKNDAVAKDLNLCEQQSKRGIPGWEKIAVSRPTLPDENKRLLVV